MLTADPDLSAPGRAPDADGVLSCRENRSQSGPFARIAGEAIGASLRLPNMATEEFLVMPVARRAGEASPRAEGVRVEVRAKDTRARMVTRFKDGDLRLSGRPLPADAGGAGSGGGATSWPLTPPAGRPGRPTTTG